MQFMIYEEVKKICYKFEMDIKWKRPSMRSFHLHLQFHFWVSYEYERITNKSLIINDYIFVYFWDFFLKTPEIKT